jgi:hypothetical protein
VHAIGYEVSCCIRQIEESKKAREEEEEKVKENRERIPTGKNA